MCLEEIWLGVEKAPCSDCLVGVEVIFLSQFCEGELGFVAGNPVPKSGHGNFSFVLSAHCSYCHIQGVALVVVCESCEDEFWWVGCFGELAVRKSFLAGSAKIELNSVFLESPRTALDHFFRRIAVRARWRFELEILEHGCQGLFLGH